MLTVAVSCSNSGRYGCARAIHALAQEGLAPSWLGRVNRMGLPQNATVFSIVSCWALLMVQFFETEDLFVNLFGLQRSRCMDIDLLVPVKFPAGAKGKRTQQACVQGAVLSLRDLVRHHGSGRLPGIDGVVRRATCPFADWSTCSVRSDCLVQTEACRHAYRRPVDYETISCRRGAELWLAYCSVAKFSKLGDKYCLRV